MFRHQLLASQSHDSGHSYNYSRDEMWDPDSITISLLKGSDFDNEYNKIWNHWSVVKGTGKTTAALDLKPKDDKKSVPSECNKYLFPGKLERCSQILPGILYHTFSFLIHTSYKIPIMTYFRNLNFKCFITVNERQFDNLLI